MTTFSAQISAWARKTERRAEAVFKQSAQEVFSIAQTPVKRGGNMPIDTGFLRGSLQTGLNGAAGVKGDESHVLAIAAARLGDIIEGGWTAQYALPVELGAGGRPGRLFMNSAAQQWQDIVARNARDAQARNP